MSTLYARRNHAYAALSTVNCLSKQGEIRRPKVKAHPHILIKLAFARGLLAAIPHSYRDVKPIEQLFEELEKLLAFYGF